MQTLGGPTRDLACEQEGVLKREAHGLRKIDWSRCTCARGVNCRPVFFGMPLNEANDQLRLERKVLRCA